MYEKDNSAFSNGYFIDYWCAFLGYLKSYGKNPHVSGLIRGNNLLQCLCLICPLEIFKELKQKASRHGKFLSRLLPLLEMHNKGFLRASIAFTMNHLSIYTSLLSSRVCELHTHEKGYYYPCSKQYLNISFGFLFGPLLSEVVSKYSLFNLLNI